MCTLLVTSISRLSRIGDGIRQHGAPHAIRPGHSGKPWLESGLLVELAGELLDAVDEARQQPVRLPGGPDGRDPPHRLAQHRGDLAAREVRVRAEVRSRAAAYRAPPSPKHGARAAGRGPELR